MTTEAAIKLLLATGVVIFLTRPLAGLLVDAFKVFLRLAFTGLLVQILPFDFIDRWSEAATGFANISATYVPVVALMFLIGMSTANLVFLTGTKAEGIIKLILYVIGGVFTAGSASWINFEESLGSAVTGILGMVVSVLFIVADALGISINR